MSATVKATGLSAGHGARVLFSGLDLVLAPGDVVGLVGANGAGKSTLLGMLLGELPLVSGTRTVGRRTVIGAIEQDRQSYAGDDALVDEVAERTGLAPVHARTLLAKFGLGADHIGRASSSLSPGERSWRSSRHGE